MNSGHGRLILRDGTDLPIGYCLFHAQCSAWCSGILIGNIRSVDPGIFCQSMQVALDDGKAFIALVTGYSDRHVRFVAKFDAPLEYSVHAESRHARGRPLDYAF